jgi:hypothetical protein
MLRAPERAIRTRAFSRHGKLRGMFRLPLVVCSAVGLLAGLPGASATLHASDKSGGASPSQAASAGSPSAASPRSSAGCLASGNGFLRARIRGALNLDIDWHNNEIECEGGPRPDGSGIRVSFAGPKHSDGRRMRMVFGVGDAKEGQAGRELPTNLTVIFEGEQRLFATRGDDRCTVDKLEQERLGALGGPRRSYRMVASGFCISPASTLSGDGRILVTRFDFAGNATFEDQER